MNDAVIDALAEQLACYRRLAKLAAVQHDHIQKGQTEQLLTVLQSRQEVLDQLAARERIIAPAKRNWQEYASTLSADARARAESLLAETRALLEQITNADRNDVLILQQRKLNIGKRITKTTVAKHVNRTYAAAAYASSRPRMDLQM